MQIKFKLNKCYFDFVVLNLCSNLVRKKNESEFLSSKAVVFKLLQAGHIETRFSWCAVQLQVRAASNHDICHFVWGSAGT